MRKTSLNNTPLILRWIIPVVVTVGLGGWLFCWLQATQEFSYFYREQQQIFLYDATYISELFMQVGGVGAVVAQFLTQFFVLPYMGALISTMVTLAVGWLFWLTLRKLNDNPAWMPLAFVPPVLYNIYISDAFAHYDGLVALLALAFLLWFYSLLSRCAPVVRCIFALVMAVLLFFGFGSIATLFALAIVLFDGLKGVAKWGWTIWVLVAVLIVGLVANNQAWVVTPEYAFGMKDYVEYYFEPDMFYAMAWISVLCIIGIVGVLGHLGRFGSLKLVSNIAILFVLLVALPLTATHLSKNHLDTNMYDIQQVSHYANQEDWDKVIAFAQPRTGNYIFLNYLNLAYAKKGQLLSHLFAIPQQGYQSLIMDYEQYTDIGILMARLYYYLGVVGLSQFHAFSSNMSVTYGSPAMTQQMIINYIINGRYQIAEKSLRMLEKSWYYADWAREQRRFLYNDQAVEADPELGMKRKDLPDHDGFSMAFGPMNDLRNVIDANPEETSAVEYAIGMMLLNRDFASLRMFVESKYGVVKIWPECLQEAIVAYSEKDMDYCRQYGVSEEVIQRFAQFRQESLTLRHSGGSVSQLAGKWGKSFWYYMLKTTRK